MTMEKLVQIGSGHALGVAATYGALIILLGVVLAARVILRRRGQQIALGDGDDKEMRRRIRVHGNFSEYAPFILAILILLPLLGAPEWLIHVLGAAGLTGRVLHAIGLSKTAGVSVGRLGGMVLTFSSLVFGAIALLVLAWFR